MGDLDLTTLIKGDKRGGESKGDDRDDRSHRESPRAPPSEDKRPPRPGSARRLTDEREDTNKPYRKDSPRDVGRESPRDKNSQRHRSNEESYDSPSKGNSEDSITITASQLKVS